MRAIEKQQRAYIQLLLKTVDKEPAELGHKFGRWTGERLATYVCSETGITLSGSQVRRILKRKKFSYIWARSRRAEYSVRRTRAAKYSLEDKQNPVHRAEFKKKLGIVFGADNHSSQGVCKYGFGTRQALV